MCWCSVDGLRVRMVTLSGRVVAAFQGDRPILTLDGLEQLPNGTYLAVFELCLHGEWVYAGRERLCILS